MRLLGTVFKGRYFSMYRALVVPRYIDSHNLLDQGNLGPCSRVAEDVLTRDLADRWEGRLRESGGHATGLRTCIGYWEWEHRLPRDFDSANNVSER